MCERVRGVRERAVCLGSYIFGGRGEKEGWKGGREV